MKTFNAMLKTEIKLSMRGLDMLIFAICMPLVVLVVIGIIYGDKPAFDGAGYSFLQQSFGGVASIAICAGGVMGLPLVVSDYRGRHILKRLKVTPARPIIILLVQLTIYALYALVSLLTLFVVAVLFFGFSMEGSPLLFIMGWLLVMASMFSIGMMVGGVAKDYKAAGALASLLYFPMLVLSGATIPYEIMPLAMQKIVDIMPLTQGIKILKSATLGMPIDGMILPICIMLLLAIACTGIAVRFFKWE